MIINDAHKTLNIRFGAILKITHKKFVIVKYELIPSKSVSSEIMLYQFYFLWYIYNVKIMMHFNMNNFEHIISKNWFHGCHPSDVRNFRT